MKKLIIVCEEKCRIYGDYLAQLVSLDDDTGDAIIGTKDGDVAAQVWLEKDYQANAAQMSSSQYLLFIGNSKLLKEKRSHMTLKYSQFGLKYGWLGKQAALCVDDVLSLEEYERFISYARGYQADVKLLVERKPEVVSPKQLPAATENNGQVPTQEKGILAPMRFLPAVVANAPVKSLNALKMLAVNRKIEEQQYNCLVLIFYLDALADFLGL
jgi:hypothetical protein